jgi:sterol desaturase/sphingolipid hydroxylase (fatty acid hydroxylase superfamily)
MDRVVDSGRITDPPSKRLAEFAALAALVLLAAVAWALESSILLPAEWRAGYESLVAAVGDWAAAHLPATLLPLVRTLAKLVLSPLLYLGFATVFVAERLAPADERQQPLSRGMIHDGLAWYLINAPLAALAFTGTLGLLYLVLDQYAPFLRIDPKLTGRLPTWTLVVAAVVLGDFMKWVHHYIMHKVPLLWQFHSVHHSQRELNLFTQARFHAAEYVTLAPIMYVPLYVLNLDFELAVWIVIGTEWYSRITHANLRTHFGPLRYALVTPQSHRIHHSRDRRHHDQNFGTVFSLWDRLFGTQWPDHDEYPATGIADEDFPWEKSVGGSSVLANYFAQLVYPFQRLLRSWRSK